DVRFEDPAPVDDERVGDDAIERFRVAGAGLLTHSVAQHLPAAELALIAVNGLVALHFGDEVRVAEAHPIAGGRSIEVGVVASVDSAAHGFSSACAKASDEGADNAAARRHPSTRPAA